MHYGDIYLRELKEIQRWRQRATLMCFKLNISFLCCVYPFQLIDELCILIKFDKKDSAVVVKFQYLVQTIREKSQLFCTILCTASIHGCLLS